MSNTEKVVEAVAEELCSIAAKLPCMTGRMECRCDGCGSSLALLRAHEFLSSGHLLEARMAIHTADSAMTSSDIRYYGDVLDVLIDGGTVLS